MRLIFLLVFLWSFPVNAAEGEKIALSWDGVDRVAWLYAPPHSDAHHGRPLVVALHGAGGDPLSFAATTGLVALADGNEAYVVFPEGLNPGDRSGWRAWNAVFCCGPVARLRVDDQGFILAMIDRLMDTYDIDPRRIYVTGLSNGGMLAYRLAALAPEKIAAIAVVAGTIGGTAGQGALPISLAPPARPVPVLVVHGRKDPFILFNGGISRKLGIPGRFTVSVDDSVRFWRTVDQCAPDPRVTERPDGLVEDAVWSNCADGTAVELLALRDVEHQWPDTLPDERGGTMPSYRRIWHFLAGHVKQ